MKRNSPEPKIFLPGEQMPESITYIRAFNDPASPTIAEVEAEAKMYESQKQWESEGNFRHRNNVHVRTGKETEDDIEKRLLQDIENLSAEMRNPSVIYVDDKTEIILPHVSTYFVLKF